MAATPQFTVDADTDRAGELLVVGATSPGMAGLSAADYLTEHLAFEQAGRISASGFPTIAPVTDGQPRHPMRLYHGTDTDLTVLLAESFVPVWAAEPFAEGLVSWTETAGVDEIGILHGVPFPHDPERHEVSVVATTDFREHRLANADLPALPGGVLDGFVGELLVAGLEEETPGVGAFVTPTHPPGPDLDATLLLLEALETVSGITIDRADLQKQADQQRQYYEELAERMQSLEKSGTGPREFGVDRMFM